LIVDPHGIVRAQALRTAGEVGRIDLAEACASSAKDADLDCRFWGSWSSVILGDRTRGLEALQQRGTQDAVRGRLALALALQTMGLGAAHKFLQNVGSDPAMLRTLIYGSGIAGDAKYLPWLINHMKAVPTARLAADSFSLIAGADLSALNLFGPQPVGFEAGPNDDPDDPNVELDPDDALPWPDVSKVERWWAANSSRFHAGTRYFMGAPVTREHCIDVLRRGYQPQRTLAAQYLCLLDPGTPLFNTSAPAWRQQRLLAKMS
jgi:uncharacterized protein (TIGR02270 family)